jgi:hypothetical protein
MEPTVYQAPILHEWKHRATKRKIQGTIIPQNSQPSIQIMVPDIFLFPAQPVPYGVNSLTLAAVSSADFSNVLST